MADSVLRRLKHRLQFTGWLQYLPIALLSVLGLLTALVLLLLHHRIGALTLLVVGLFFAASFLFDLATVKLNLHPREGLPRRRDDLDIFDLMRARRACRSFQQRKLTGQHYEELMEHVRRECSPPTDTMFEKRRIRFEYVAAPLTVWPVVGAGEFLVAIAPAQYDRRAVLDVGRTLQRIVMQATRMGLATCWIGPGAHHGSVEGYLGDRYDPEKDHIICVCAVGYRSHYKPLFLRFMQLIQRRRRPITDLFYRDAGLSNPIDAAEEPFSRFGRTFEACEWSPSSFNSQTTRGVAITAGDGGKLGLERMDFYAVTASRYYAAVALGIWCANWELCCEELGKGGRFEVLPTLAAMAREESGEPLLPRYDISWVSEQPAAAEGA